MLAAPVLCQVFKGVRPSDLAEKYLGVEHGAHALEFDLEIAMEIQNQREQAMGKVAQKDQAAGAVARRDQKRARRNKETISGSEMLEHLKKKGFARDDDT